MGCTFLRGPGKQLGKSPSKKTLPSFAPSTNTPYATRPSICPPYLVKFSIGCCMGRLQNNAADAVGDGVNFPMLLYRLCNGLLYLECRIGGRFTHRSVNEIVTVHNGP